MLARGHGVHLLGAIVAQSAGDRMRCRPRMELGAAADSRIARACARAARRSGAAAGTSGGGRGAEVRARNAPASAPWSWWHAVKLATLPAIALALAYATGLSPLERQVAVAMAAVPTAPSAYILAVQMKAAGAPVALLISTGTLIAAFTLPLWISAAA